MTRPIVAAFAEELPPHYPMLKSPIFEAITVVEALRRSWITHERDATTSSESRLPQAGQSQPMFPAGADEAFAFALSGQGGKRVHNADEPQGGDCRQARLSNVFDIAPPGTSYGSDDSTFC
jgi:hypothetical protein